MAASERERRGFQWSAEDHNLCPPEREWGGRRASQCACSRTSQASSGAGQWRTDRTESTAPLVLLSRSLDIQFVILLAPAIPHRLSPQCRFARTRTAFRCRPPTSAKSKRHSQPVAAGFVRSAEDILTCPGYRSPFGFSLIPSFVGGNIQ